MENRSTTLLLVLGLLVSMTAFGDTLVLDPGSSPTDVSNIGNNVDRGDVFNALADFSITSAGIFFQPLDGGAKNITVNIYGVDPDGGVGTLGQLLATASFPLADSTFTFHDVPISFDFVSGSRYYLAFTADGSSGWGFNINTMRIFDFDFPAAPFKVGDVSVVDGGCFGGVCTGFSNQVTPLIRLETDSTSLPDSTPNTSEVPEPSSLAVMLLGGIGLGLWRKTAQSR